MIVNVTPDLAVDMWPVLAPIFKRVTATTNGCYEPADILRDILNGKQALWVAWDQAALRVDIVATTELVDHPRRRVCVVRYVAGDNMKTWLSPMVEMIESYARDCGATGIEGGGRDGWEHAYPGMKRTGATLFKDLAP